MTKRVVRQASWDVYVASSWRCSAQPRVVAALRGAGVTAYDFRNPAPGQHGFAWQAAGLHTPLCTGDEYRAALRTPVAAAGFAADMLALERCAAVVCVLPCGRSAHLELGWAVGAGKATAVVLDEDGLITPELMYLMVDLVVDGNAAGMAELIDWLDAVVER